MTWPRAVWDTWGYRIRPTAWRGAPSVPKTKGLVFSLSAPPLSVRQQGLTQCKSSVNEVGRTKGGDPVWIN